MGQKQNCQHLEGPDMPLPLPMSIGSFIKKGDSKSLEETIKKKKVLEILALLETMWLPKKRWPLFIVRNIRPITLWVRGNTFTDQAAKEVAQKPVGLLQMLLFLLEWTLPQTPQYSSEELGLEELIEQRLTPKDGCAFMMGKSRGIGIGTRWTIAS